MTLVTRLILSFALLLVPTHAFAVLDVGVTMSPTNPAPYQETTITLTSTSFDVNGAMITWKSGGTTLLSGLGAKKVTVTTGASGQEIPISYSATTVNGDSVSGSFIVSSQSVELLYESRESFIPPFYQGRSLPSEGAIVRVTALPSLSEGGVRIQSSSLAYSWYLNGEFLENASGVGRSVATIALDYLSDSNEVRVVVRSPRGSVAEKRTSISPHAVMPLFYSYDEVLGTNLTKTFWRRLETSKDITLSLVPFYFSSKNEFENTASYTWYLDGLPVTPMEKTLLSLRPKENSAGIRTLSAVVESTKRKLQKATNEIEVIFDTRPN